MKGGLENVTLTGHIESKMNRGNQLVKLDVRTWIKIRRYNKRTNFTKELKRKLWKTISLMSGTGTAHKIKLF